MANYSNISLLKSWESELKESISSGESLCVAVFSIDKTLLFVNKAFLLISDNLSYRSFINPVFDKFISADTKDKKIFQGVVTLGDYNSINQSITADVYRKNNEILIVGGIDAKQLVHQNTEMHNLNREINNLQRKLIKKNSVYEDTLDKLKKSHKELQDLNYEIQAQNKELNELNATKDKLFKILAHDLRNPFNIILGFSSLMVNTIESNSGETIKTYAKHVHNSAEQTYKLLENLLKWASLQTGHLKPKPESFSPAEIINESIDLISHQAKNKQISIDIKIENNQNVFADKEMIKTVLRNLITNAIKFTNENGLITIKSEKNESGDAVVFSVTDNGIGISEDDIKKLFRIESTLSKKGTNNEVGTGLGLILCKDFIEQNSGKLEVSSELNKGSTFKFSLPITSI